MRPICLLALLLTTIPAISQANSKPDDIITRETSFWTAYAAGDTASLAQIFSPAFTNVEQDIWTGDKVLAFVKAFHAQCSLAPVKIGDPHVTFLTPDAATIVYHATETPTCGGRSMSGETNISTVWVRAGGIWKMHLHTEYAVPPK